MAKRKTPTPEEIMEQRLASQLKELREGYLPEPTRIFKPGDRVEIGSLDNVVVLHSIDDGKIIHVRYDHLKEENSNTPASYNQEGMWAWVDVLFYRAHAENKKIPLFKTTGLDMYRKFSFYQQEVASLMFKAYKNGVEMDTEYQRPLVWTLEEKQNLIESMFHTVDIGKFVFIKLPYSEWATKKGFEILDGKQRLSTLMEFFEDRFTYKGKKFSELAWTDQMHLEHFPVMYAEATNLSKKEIYGYFLLLNVAGVPQSEEHLAQVRKLFERTK